jgi:hypothetical protein
MSSLLHPAISTDGYDFTTCQPLPLLSVTRGRDPGLRTNVHGGFPLRISTACLGPRVESVISVWHEGTWH